MSNVSTPIVDQFFGPLGSSDFFERFWPHTAYSEHGDMDRLLLKTLCRGELIVPLWFEPMPGIQ